jgi:hypothetical protein
VQEDLDAIQSPFAATMMESCSVTQAKRLSDMFPHASREALDLLSGLLHVRHSTMTAAGQHLCTATMQAVEQMDSKGTLSQPNRSCLMCSMACLWSVLQHSIWHKAQFTSTALMAGHFD